MGNKSLKIFFVYLGISMVISAIKVDIQTMNGMQIVTTLFQAWYYNFLSAVPGALLAMIIADIYLEFKKKVINEKDSGNRGGVCFYVRMA